VARLHNAAPSGAASNMLSGAQLYGALSGASPPAQFVAVTPRVVADADRGAVAQFDPPARDPIALTAR